MGKPTGFLEYSRVNNPSVEPEVRIKDFSEFHPPLSQEDRMTQAARCMNCGVPFCQSAMKLNGMVSGCPLHNLIPEWNDEIYNGKWEHALSRLSKTNNFPEVTGRVCPALCEAACTCGLNDTAVTVRENELSIIENGFAQGYVKPRIPKIRSGKKVAVIGSGPSGMACADQLNQRGHEVTVFEREDRIGGLLMYGIPNMKLDKSIVDRRVKLMEEEGVKFVTGADIGNTVDADKILNEFNAVVLCCGASNPRDLKVENRDVEGVYFAVDFLKSTTKALLNGQYESGNFISAKDKKVVVIGGGDTGNDCVGTCIRHGCESVIQLEMMPKLPDERAENNPWPQWPRVCKTDYGQQEAIAKFGNDPRIYQTTVKRFISDDSGNLTGIEIISLTPQKDEKTGRMNMVPVEGTERVLEADLVLIAAGFLGASPYVTEAFGVETNARTNVATSSENNFMTNVDKVFVAGDMHRGQSLVVWAIAEGRAAAKEVDMYLMQYSNMI